MIAGLRRGNDNDLRSRWLRLPDRRDRVRDSAGLCRHLGSHRPKFVRKASRYCLNCNFNLVYAALKAVQLDAKEAKAANHYHCDDADNPTDAIYRGPQSLDRTLQPRKSRIDQCSPICVHVGRMGRAAISVNGRSLISSSNRLTQATGYSLGDVVEYPPWVIQWCRRSHLA